MLSGGYVTGAALYMQTIFRGQTPYKNGAIKTNCYAFDFAPDRTVTVNNDYIKQQPSSNNKQHKPGDDVQRIATSLRFMPVIAMVGGKEVEYNAETFIQRVNKAYTDHVVSHGFKSKRLFKNFANFKPEDHELLDKIGKLIGGGKGVKVEDGIIVMTDEGLTGENGGKGKNTGKGNKGGKGNKKPKTSKKQANDESEQRRRSQNVLDYIFVRLPLLLFGAVSNPTGLTIDELLSDDIIDQESWIEFMPPKFTKGMFKQLSHLIAVDVLISSTAEIIKMTRKADGLPIQQRIIEMAHIVSRFHFPDKETVLTPWKVVNMHMTDTLGGYDFYDEKHERWLEDLRLVEREGTTETIFCDPDTKILEINSKSGVYPLWLACTLWKLLGHPGMSSDEEWQLWKSVLKNNLYVVCKTRMAEKITRRVLVGYREDIPVNTVSFNNLIERIKDEKELEKLIQEIKNPATYNNSSATMIDFKVIVGNPPYQLMDGGYNASATPIYNLFVNMARLISPSYLSMIMPAKWYTGGKNLDQFRKSMLTDRHIRQLMDYEDSKFVFPSVDIAGGVCYFLWDKSYDGLCSVINVRANSRILQSVRDLSQREAFIRHQEALAILNKVESFGEQGYSSRVSSQKPFGLRTFVKPTDSGDIRLRYNAGEGPFHRSDVLSKTEWIDKWKVITNRNQNEHAGQADKDGKKRILSTTEILPPGTICTETYIVIDTFDDEQSANNLLEYLKTKFCRFLISLVATTQSVSKESFRYVPVLDFSEHWSDEKLNKKYKLTDDEIDYIDSIIKPM